MKFHSFQFWYQSLYFWQCQHAFYFVCFHLCPLFMLHLAVLLYNSKVQVSKYCTCAGWRVNLSLWLSLHCLEVNSLEVHSLIDIISSYPVGGERKIYIQNMDWCIVIGWQFIIWKLGWNQCRVWTNQRIHLRTKFHYLKSKAKYTIGVCTEYMVYSAYKLKAHSMKYRVDPAGGGVYRLEGGPTLPLFGRERRWARLSSLI